MYSNHANCAKKSRNKFKLNEVSKIRYKSNNLSMREDMKILTNNLEKLAKKEAKSTDIKLYDLSTSLPPALFERVTKIIPLLPIQADNFEEENEGGENTGITLEPRNYFVTTEEFNESTCSFIKKLEDIYSNFEVNIEHKTEGAQIAKTPRRKKNWLSGYICSTRKDRIKWNSKLYPLDTNIEDKKLDEQAELLMDTASQRFTEWINNINKNTETNITKEFLMSLFQVNSGSSLINSIQIEPKIMGAVPKEVAVTWQMPENSIDLKLANKIKEVMGNVPDTVIKVAFGSTLPYNMQPWTPTDAYNIIKPTFPDDLRKCKLLFEGITHLKATRQFVKYFHSNIDIEKPEYLVEVGCFKKRKHRASIENEIPLYELLNCRF